MNMFTNTRKHKKFILILVMLILFSFCYPKRVKALNFDDLQALPAEIFYALEKGLMKMLNDMFTNEEYHSETISDAIESENASDGDVIMSETIKLYLTPENIIKGRFIIFDANIFKEIKNDANYYDYVQDGAVSTGKIALRNTISGWYKALRSFAIIALLSVLVYVGIRMIISTVAQDKAKYKAMFKDWLVALCLLMAMHYIMIGTLNIASDITNALGSGKNTNFVESLTRDISAILTENWDEEGTPNDSYSAPATDKDGNVIKDANGEEMKLTIGDAYAKILVLGGIIVYTLIFAIKYLKREFTIIFLILLGPVSCITYPIDKISDGKAQAFNRWLTEFIYQVIIQPFHLLLYIVLVGSAVELANANVIYALVCFAVMIPAEKFIKEMFGFKDKLGSPLGKLATAGIASKALSSLMKGGKGGSGKDGEKDNNSTPNELPPKTIDKANLTDGDTGTGSQAASGDQPDRVSTRQPEEQIDAEGNGQENIDDEDGALPPGSGDNDQQEIGEGDDESSQILTRDENQEQLNQGNPEGEDNTPRTLKDKLKYGKDKIANSKAWAIHEQRVSKKYGSTNRGRRWINRGKRGAKALAKGAAIAGVGTIAASTALLTGNGKEALGIAAGVGAMAFKTGKRTISGAVGAAKDYKRNLKDDTGREREALKDFKGDKNQIDKAVLSYRKNHDGKDPGYKALEQEMEDRFALSRKGLSDDTIDDSIGEYQNLRDQIKNRLREENPNLSEKELQEQAQKKALDQTAFAAKLADDYSKKDFRSEKTMKEALNSLSKDFEEFGVSPELAQITASDSLHRAARIKGVDIALPTTNRTLDIGLPSAGQTATAMGIDVELEPSQIEQINHINVRLREEGYDNSAINRIATTVSYAGGDNAADVINKYEASVDYLTDGSTRSEAAKITTEINDGNKPTKKQINTTTETMLELKDRFNVPKESISKVAKTDLSLEKKKVTKQLTQKQLGRQFALDNKGNLNNQGRMEGAVHDLEQRLIREAGITPEQAKKDAQNIVGYAGLLNGETTILDNNK